MATVINPGMNPVPPIPPQIAEDDTLYEVVRGQRMELPPMSAYAGIIASRLTGEIIAWCKSCGLGQAVSEVLFSISEKDRLSRRPDVAFVSYQRWPKDKPLPDSDNAWAVVPDLAVEVISPTDRAEELVEKVEEYFGGGVQQVWVVYPRRKVVHIYHSPRQMVGLSAEETLEGDQVLPGFTLKLSELFPQ